MLYGPNRCNSRNVLASKPPLLASRAGPVDRSDLVSGVVGCAVVLRGGGVSVDMTLLLGVSDDDPVRLVAPSELGAGDLSALPVLAVHSFLSDEVGGAKEAFVAF